MAKNAQYGTTATDHGEQGKAKDCTEHRTIGRDRGVGKMKRAVEVKQKISDLRKRSTRNRVTLSPTPSPVSQLASLVIHAGERTAAVGKLACHYRREAETSRCSLAI